LLVFWHGIVDAGVGDGPGRTAIEGPFIGRGQIFEGTTICINHHGSEGRRIVRRRRPEDISRRVSVRGCGASTATASATASAGSQGEKGDKKHPKMNPSFVL
jgi:hypothetical protein